MELFLEKMRIYLCLNKNIKIKMLEKLTRRAGAESIKERERSELVLKS